MTMGDAIGFVGLVLLATITAVSIIGLIHGWHHHGRWRRRR
jgi:hypothetical protein